MLQFSVRGKQTPRKAWRYKANLAMSGLRRDRLRQRAGLLRVAVAGCCCLLLTPGQPQVGARTKRLCGADTGDHGDRSPDWPLVRGLHLAAGHRVLTSHSHKQWPARAAKVRGNRTALCCNPVWWRAGAGAGRVASVPSPSPPHTHQSPETWAGVVTHYALEHSCGGAWILVLGAGVQQHTVHTIPAPAPPREW